jgi:PAS domain S-box-containing protein
VPLAVAIAFALGALAGALAAGWWWWRPRLQPLDGDAVLDLATRLRRAQALTDHANDMMLLADDDHRLVEVNDRLCELLGYTREEALRLSVRDLRDPATLEDLAIRKREQIEAGGAVFETRFQRKDRSIFPVEVSVRVIEIGGKSHFQATIRDISERKRLELELQLADRMASVATLAGGVAHEVNNPLAYVLANVDYALSRLDRLPAEQAEVKKALEDARGGATRVAQVVRDLRTFSRGGESERQELDVRQVLQTAVAMAQPELRQHARLSLELGPVPPVLGNAHRLNQLFLNLLVNAAQAIPVGQPERNQVQLRTALAPDGRVQIDFTDSGSGIPAEQLPRIFDPFFTTRAVGKGVGLGLAIVHAIVTDLGGEVSVRSEPGAGSTFTVLLPPARRAAAAADGPPQELAAPVKAPGPATAAAVTPASSPVADILVIDDEALVGRAIARMLSPPHRVVAVCSAVEALKLLASHHYDTIFCDLMMPEMTGMALHQRLLASAPDQAARMVFLSGGAFTAEATGFLERVPNARLEKPFTPAELRAAVVALQRASPG